jgi:hypothetical protein
LAAALLAKIFIRRTAMNQNQFEVRVSRRLLLLLIVVGLLFSAVGLDLLFLHIVFEPVGAGQSPILMILFGAFCLLLGAVIVVSQVYYLIIPPVMLRVTREGLWFGTGLRYKPYFVPIKSVKSINTYQTESMLEVGGQRRIVEGGVELVMDRTDDLPSSLATSAGLSYSDYSLRLFKTYMNRPPQKAVEAVKSFIHK